uniref:Uncharacterized protein n=1 Tax=Solanum lycopersicum TaxID=4081 RepID=A0A3Q7I1D6_SOLLC
MGMVELSCEDDKADLVVKPTKERRVFFMANDSEYKLDPGPLESNSTQNEIAGFLPLLQVS